MVEALSPQVEELARSGDAATIGAQAAGPSRFMISVCSR
jgi:hypothetical protein